ncbi:MAG: hypothetical protein KF863_17360 [Rubrivivax sp.]|jgi:hypothetical protein|nr:hypothetical protein [Rubrivivax sp.]
MKSMWVVMVAVVAFGGWRLAEAQPAAPIEQQVVLNDDAARVLKDLNPERLRLTARRYSSSSAAEESYKRLEGALADLAESRGVRSAGNGGEATLLAEIDSTFYVYTNRFNARLVRLTEYTEAQTASATGGPSVAADKPVDVLRIAAGALGIVRGWISPSFGSYMMAGGAAPALFGSGDAPRRLFVAGRERYERGEQEVNTRVRILRDGTVVAAFSVRCWTQGDAPPFRIDELVSANWTEVLSQLGAPPASGGGKAPQNE